ncbi:MAG: hypothetical protein U0T81_04125 [Saprospiraceae bacterium]
MNFNYELSKILEIRSVSERILEIRSVSGAKILEIQYFGKQKILRYEEIRDDSQK